MAVAQQLFVSLDCDDPVRLGEFWAAMLGGDVVFARAGAVGVRTSWVWLAAIRVPDFRPPTWPAPDVPQQIHLDLGVSDLEPAVAEALGLGARAADFQPSPEHRRVMLDPAGHPFCLTTQIPSEARESSA